MHDLNQLVDVEKDMDTAYKCPGHAVRSILLFMITKCSRSVYSIIYDHKRFRQNVVCGNLLDCKTYSLSAASRIKFRVTHIKVFAVELFLNQAESLTETLEMHDFTLTQKTDRFTDFRIFDKT